MVVPSFFGGPKGDDGMGFRFKGALTMLAVFMVAGPAFADPEASSRKSRFGPGQPYVEGYLGGVFSGSVEESSSLFGTLDLERQNTVVVGGAVGYRLPLSTVLAVRGEFDGSFAPVGVADQLPPGVSVFNDLDAGVFSTLANVWLDVETPIGVTPYVGAGVGLGFIGVEDSDANNVGLAYQLGGGLQTDVPGTRFYIGLNYRYFVTDVDLDDLGILEQGPFGSSFTLVDVDTRLEGHRAALGLGYRF